MNEQSRNANAQPNDDKTRQMHDEDFGEVHVCFLTLFLCTHRALANCIAGIWHSRANMAHLETDITAEKILYVNDASVGAIIFVTHVPLQSRGHALLSISPKHKSNIHNPAVIQDTLVRKRS